MSAPRSNNVLTNPREEEAEENSENIEKRERVAEAETTRYKGVSPSFVLEIDVGFSVQQPVGLPLYGPWRYDADGFLQIVMPAITMQKANHLYGSGHGCRLLGPTQFGQGANAHDRKYSATGCHSNTLQMIEPSNDCIQHHGHLVATATTFRPTVIGNHGLKVSQHLDTVKCSDSDLCSSRDVSSKNASRKNPRTVSVIASDITCKLFTGFPK